MNYVEITSIRPSVRVLIPEVKPFFLGGGPFHEIWYRTSLQKVI